MNRSNLHNLFHNIFNLTMTKALLYSIIIAFLYLFYKSVLAQNIFSSLSIILLPFILIIATSIFIYADKIIYALFISQFIFTIAGNFIDFQLGIVNLVFTFICLLILIINSTYKTIDWKQSYNGMLILYLIWTSFCILEIANPNHVQAAWNIAITHYAFYPIICSILVPLAIKKSEHVEWLFTIWAIFILIMAIKGYWQKSHGFNERELYFLYELGRARTHLIWSGIRYFSFFSDAANFGVHMGMGATALTIALFYVRNFFLKLFYFIVLVAAFYGMAISGTRAAMAVPFTGLMLYILLSKSKIGILLGVITLVFAVFFFRFTYIGDSNEYIRKMRSAFYASEDASYQVRISNRKKMKVLMASKPFGYGIGLGGKADRFHPKELMPYPPDSWLVNVWTDTGIIGLVIYLLIHITLFTWCAWILLLKIKHKRLKGLLSAWLCANAGYFVAAYANDVMQYPNSIVIYIGFALCFVGPYIDQRIEEDKNQKYTI